MTKPQIIPFDRNAPLVPWADFPEAEIASGTLTFDTSGNLVSQTQTSNFNPLGAVNPQALHAETIGFVHPVTGRPMELTCPLPPDFAAVLEVLPAWEEALDCGFQAWRCCYP